MYIADTKRLTLAGARKMMATAVGQAEQAGISITVAIAAGSSRRTSSAKLSALPLCGVAEARISASVRGARTRASV